MDDYSELLCFFPKPPVCDPAVTDDVCVDDVSESDDSTWIIFARELLPCIMFLFPPEVGEVDYGDVLDLRFVEWVCFESPSDEEVWAYGLDPFSYVIFYFIVFSF